jgi:hypothetical protein
MPKTTQPEARSTRADSEWDAFCSHIYIAREPLRRQEARVAALEALIAESALTAART